MNETEYFIGLISGTSSDGIDASLVEFDQQQKINVLNTLCLPLPDDVRNNVVDMVTNKTTCFEKLGELHIKLGKLFAQAANQVCDGFDKSKIKAIGSHGQTIFHQPDSEHAFTLQIGCAATIARLTGVTTIADFRSSDIAAGGQGAPLAPAFHDAVFRSGEKTRAIVNIGGIANVTLLTKDNSPVLGFDTGPGNGLMDAWTECHLHKPYDENGDWARGGEQNPSLLSELLADPYIKRKPPKSTGKEAFNLRWLQAKLESFHRHHNQLDAQDIQTNLAHFTAAAIAASFAWCVDKVEDVYVCGGGAANGFLMQLLQDNLPNTPVQTTRALGIHPDYVEAITFAWLAKKRLAGEGLNLTSITGSTQAVYPGAVYLV